MKRLADKKQKQGYFDQFELDTHIPAEILSACELWQFDEGDFLSREGELSTSFYLLVSGKLQVGYLHPNGHQAVMAYLSPLAVIGDIELFEERESASNVNVRAVEGSHLLVTSAEIAKKYGAEDPRFLRFLLRYLARKISFSSTLQAQVSLSAESRLARYLLKRFNDEGGSFQLEKREGLAALLGTSVRHLNRTLKKFSTNKIVSVHNKSINILDHHALSLILEKDD